MITILLALTLGFPQNTPQPDRIIGLLELPEIFGEMPCTIYPSVSVRVHSRPANDSSVIGSIEVTRPWRLQPDAECESIEVRVRKLNANEELPTREMGYEIPAAIVLEQAGWWLRIRLQSGSGWVRQRDPAQFHPYAELLHRALTYINKGWDGRLWPSPEAPSSTPVPTPWQTYINDDVTAEVLDTRIVGGQLWLHMRFSPEFGCDRYPATLPKAEGWLPAYRSTGEESVWFHSRGC